MFRTLLIILAKSSMVLVGSIIAISLISTCSSEEQVNCECMFTEDCPEGYFCGNIDKYGCGECLCVSNQTCEDYEYCNEDGYCEMINCETSEDCADPDSWQCLIYDNQGFGRCRCISDDACSVSQYCADDGYCRDR